MSIRPRDRKGNELPKAKTQGESKPTSIVLPPDLKAEIWNAADRSGRKPAAEIRARLEASLAFDEAIFGHTPEKHLNRILANAVIAIAEVIERTDGHWRSSGHSKEILKYALFDLVEKGVVISKETRPRARQSEPMTNRQKGKSIAELIAPRLDQSLTPSKFLSIKNNTKDQMTK